MALEHVQELFDFIQQSPSCFHVIENVKKQLTEQGFEELCAKKQKTGRSKRAENTL